LRDRNKPSTAPHVTRLILAVNIILFTIYWLSSLNIFLDTSFATFIEQNFVMVPDEIVRGQRLYTLFTSMFMHASWFHLLGNMLYLYVFGDNVEDVFGHSGYLVFYLVSGLVGDFAHIMSLQNASDFYIGVLGASGAISGALGAYLVLYPRAKILTLVFFFWIRIVSIPAVAFLGFWFLMQWFYGLFAVGGGVAYWAHIGGFVTGVIAALIFGRNKPRRISA